MADFNVTKNQDGSYKLTVTKVVTQQSAEEFSFGNLDEVSNKIKEVEAADQPQQ